MDDEKFKHIKCYNGNALLKRANQDIDWTEEMVLEVIKCSQDPVYFTEKYMKIINIDKGLINFTLYEYQKEMIRSFADNRFNIITTARQAGKCQNMNTPIRLKNKKTGAIIETTIGEFYELCKKKQLKNV